jgi:hypothetical protein
MTVPTLEARLAATNAGFFLREFSFSRTQFAPPGTTEVEVADHIVSLDDSLLIFQLKERTNPTNDAAKEERWFTNKVTKNAVRQMKGTLAYLEAQPIRLRNDRGHEVDLPRDLQKVNVAKLVVYQPGSALPQPLRNLKGHLSESAGFVHLFAANDYAGILHTLVTLPEIVGFLRYRERLCRRFPAETNGLSETCVLGHYLLGDAGATPMEHHSRYLTTLDNDTSKFEIFGILRKFKENTYAGDVTRTDGVGPSQTAYYTILKEIVRLSRTDLAAFKERFAWEYCGDRVLPPSRFASDRTGCGFVFVPLPPDPAIHAPTALRNLTVAAKYDLKVDRCVGLVFRRDGEYRLVDWMHQSHPWARDPELEALLAESSPFGPKRLEVVPTYTFRQGPL